MSQARRVLIVAYYFPPIGGIGSIRAARFASQLPRHGWEPTVLAPRRTPHAHDGQLAFPESRVVRSRSLEFGRVGVAGLRGSSTNGIPSRRSRFRRSLRTFAHRYVYFPDAQLGWYPAAILAGLRTLRRSRFDAIYSSAFPVTAHLVAGTLARRAGLPWIAEYRDPFSDRLGLDHPYARRAVAIERRVARDAAAIVMPSPTWAGHYGAKWGVPIDVVPNGHDGRLPARHPPSRPTLTHVGSYYPGEHDLTALWKGLAQLRAGGESVPRVRFVGSLPEQLRDEIASFGLDDVLESTGFIPHDQAMRELMSSSMLIASAVAGGDPPNRGWIPAKLFDYLASPLPILLVAEPDTDAAALVRDRPGCHVIGPGDAKGVLAAVRTGLAGGDYERNTDDLSREARTRSLAGVFDRVVARRE